LTSIHLLDKLKTKVQVWFNYKQSHINKLLLSQARDVHEQLSSFTVLPNSGKNSFEKCHYENVKKVA